MLKLKLQYFGHVMQRTDSLERLKEGGEGKTEDEMVGWHHQLDGHAFEYTLGVDGQGSLVCCCPWGLKESDTTEQLNWTECWPTPVCPQVNAPVFHYFLLDYKTQHLSVSLSFDFKERCGIRLSTCEEERNQIFIPFFLFLFRQQVCLLHTSNTSWTA